jgi:hypothetical protein
MIQLKSYGLEHPAAQEMETTRLRAAPCGKKLQLLHRQEMKKEKENDKETGGGGGGGGGGAHASIHDFRRSGFTYSISE